MKRLPGHAEPALCRRELSCWLLAAMLTDVRKTDTLKDLRDLHHIDSPGTAND
jgi:hypothetical protein